MLRDYQEQTVQTVVRVINGKLRRFTQVVTEHSKRQAYMLSSIKEIARKAVDNDQRSAV